MLAAAIDLGEPGDELRGAQTMLDGPSKAAALSHEAARPAEWQAEKQKEEFYTEGSQELAEAYGVTSVPLVVVVSATGTARMPQEPGRVCPAVHAALGLSVDCS